MKKENSQQLTVSSQQEEFRQVTLYDDMGGAYCLRLTVEDDGDVIVSMLPEDEAPLRFPMNEHSMQFCTMQGGGNNPEIATKLREIFEISSPCSSVSSVVEENSDELGVASGGLPELTEAVFFREDCPEWADRITCYNNQYLKEWTFFDINGNNPDTIFSKEYSLTCYKLAEDGKSIKAPRSACGRTPAQFFAAAKDDLSNVEQQKSNGKWIRSGWIAKEPLRNCFIESSEWYVFSKYRIKESPAEPENNNSPCSSVDSVVEGNSDKLGVGSGELKMGKIQLIEECEGFERKLSGWQDIMVEEWPVNLYHQCVDLEHDCFALRQKLIHRRSEPGSHNGENTCAAGATRSQLTTPHSPLTTLLNDLGEFVRAVGDGSKLPEDPEARAKEIRCLIGDVKSMTYKLEDRIVKYLQSLCEHVDGHCGVFDGGYTKCYCGKLFQENEE